MKKGEIHKMVCLGNLPPSSMPLDICLNDQNTQKNSRHHEQLQTTACHKKSFYQRKWKSAMGNYCSIIHDEKIFFHEEWIQPNPHRIHWFCKVKHFHYKQRWSGVSLSLALLLGFCGVAIFLLNQKLNSASLWQQEKLDPRCLAVSGRFLNLDSTLETSLVHTATYFCLHSL